MRRNKPILSEEGLQNLEHDLNTTTAQTVLSNAQLNHDLQRLRKHLPETGELGLYYLITSDYSTIVMRSLEINKEFAQMALSIKDDMKEVFRSETKQFKTGTRKAWIVAVNMAFWAIFFLLNVLFQQYIQTVLYPLLFP